MDLRLGQNKFHGPLTTLTSLQNLETLHINNNTFTGTIPDMFDQLFRLHELMMQRNQFVGSIPLTLTHLQSLSKYTENKVCCVMMCCVVPDRESISLYYIDSDMRYNNLVLTFLYYIFSYLRNFKSCL